MLSHVQGINDTHREKLFHSIQYKNGWLAASNLFNMLTKSTYAYKFYYQFHYHVLGVKMFVKYDSSNRQ